MIVVRRKGNLKKAYKYLEHMKNTDLVAVLQKYGQIGVDALREATPKKTGKTAEAWSYRIDISGKTIKVLWVNTNNNKHVNIAMILQTGHGTRNGGWVEGLDYINPALKPVFDQMAKEAWEEIIEK